jgi:hypothetical protein
MSNYASPIYLANSRSIRDEMELASESWPRSRAMETGGTYLKIYISLIDADNIGLKGDGWALDIKAAL